MIQKILFFGNSFSALPWLNTFLVKNQPLLEQKSIFFSQDLYNTGFPGLFTLKNDVYLPDSEQFLRKNLAAGGADKGILLVPIPGLNSHPRLSQIIATFRACYPDAEINFLVHVARQDINLEMNRTTSLLETGKEHIPGTFYTVARNRSWRNSILGELEDCWGTGGVEFFVDSTEIKTDLVRHFAGLLPLSTAEISTLDFGPPFLCRALPRDVFAYVSMVTRLFARFADPLPTNPWFEQIGLIHAGADPYSCFSPERRLQFVQMFVKQYATSSRRFGIALDFPEVDLVEDWESFPGLSFRDVERIMSTHTMGFAEYLCAFFHAIDCRLLSKREIECFSPLFSRKLTVSEWTLNAAPKVSVLTPTYNHVSFIADAIESVIAQKTDFPIEHIIADDGSTDGTAEIILDYASRYSHIVPVLHKKHVGGADNHWEMFEMVRAPYVALCDGDDYFVDKEKLQIQADLLDVNPELGLCFHPVMVTYANAKYNDRLFPLLSMLPRGIKPAYYLSDLLKWNMIQTNSVMYRWRFPEGLPEWFEPNLMPGDWYWHLLHAEKGKIGFINRTMSIYRRHSASLYYTVEEDRVLHRAKVGEAELRTYDVLNRHFQGRYESVFVKLSASVFFDLSDYAERTGDDSIFVRVVGAYHDFAAKVLKKMKELS